MEETPTAPAEAPQAPESEATPINSNPAPAAPDMHGFTSDQLAEMQKFFEANGGFDKIKSKISNPTPAPTPAEPAAAPAPRVEEPAYMPPAGSIRPDEFIAQQYFGALSREEQYAPIAKEIESGAILKDMAMFNIRPLNNDGSINDTMVRRYLDLKAQTVAAKQTSVTPEAGAAPTVDYVPVEGDIKDMRQAMAVLQQDSTLKRAGQAGHPAAEAAEKFMRSQLNPGTKK